MGKGRGEIADFYIESAANGGFDPCDPHAMEDYLQEQHRGMRAEPYSSDEDDDSDNERGFTRDRHLNARWARNAGSRLQPSGLSSAEWTAAGFSVPAADAGTLKQVQERCEAAVQGRFTVTTREGLELFSSQAFGEAKMNGTRSFAGLGDKRNTIKWIDASGAEKQDGYVRLEGSSSSWQVETDDSVWGEQCYPSDAGSVEYWARQWGHETTADAFWSAALYWYHFRSTGESLFDSAFARMSKGDFVVPQNLKKLSFADETERGLKAIRDRKAAKARMAAVKSAGNTPELFGLCAESCYTFIWSETWQCWEAHKNTEVNSSAWGCVVTESFPAKAQQQLTPPLFQACGDVPDEEGPPAHRVFAGLYDAAIECATEAFALGAERLRLTANNVLFADYATRSYEDLPDHLLHLTGGVDKKNLQERHEFLLAVIRSFPEGVVVSSWPDRDGYLAMAGPQRYRRGPRDPLAGRGSLGPAGIPFGQCEGLASEARQLREQAPNYAHSRWSSEYQNDFLAMWEKQRRKVDKRCGRRWLRNRESALAAVSRDGSALYGVVDNLRSDKDVVLAAVSNDGLALQYSSSALKADRKVVLVAVAENANALFHAPAELKCDREIVRVAVSQKGDALQYAAEEMANDLEIVLAAVSQSGDAIRHATMPMRGDRQVVLAAVARSGHALMHASATLRVDREVVLKATSQNRDALRYAGPQLLNNRDFVLAIVRTNGLSLSYASADMRADKDVVLAAVAQNGAAAVFARGNCLEDIAKNCAEQDVELGRAEAEAAVKRKRIRVLEDSVSRQNLAHAESIAAQTVLRQQNAALQREVTQLAGALRDARAQPVFNCETGATEYVDHGPPTKRAKLEVAASAFLGPPVNTPVSRLLKVKKELQTKDAAVAQLRNELEALRAAGQASVPLIFMQA